MSASYTLEDALASVQSERAEERRTGLRNLKQQLSLHQISEPTSSYGTASTRHIIEVLAGVVSHERLLFLKAQKKTIRELSRSRLSLAAATFRVAIDSQLEFIKPKLVRFIIQHLLETLPKVSGGGLLEPLSQDYLKSFQSLLEFSPHVEHLAEPVWIDAVEFCINTIQESTNAYYSRAEQKSYATERQQRNSSHSFQAEEIDSGSPAEETNLLLKCLQLLVNSSASAILQKSERIITCILSFLKLKRSSVIAHQAALRIVNSILVRISTHHVFTVCSWLYQLIPLMSDIWIRKKAVAVRDQLLMILIQVEPHLLRLLKQTSASDIIESMETLLDALMKDILDPSSKISLSLEDVCLTYKERSSFRGMPMQISCFGLASPNQKNERDWTTLYFTSFIANWLDRLNFSRSPEFELEAIPHVKRRRKLQKFDELFEQISIGQPRVRLSLMQLVPFYIHYRAMTTNEIDSVLTCLVHYAKDDQDLIPSWSLLAIASCAVREDANSEQLTSQWQVICDIALRLLPSFKHTRAASYVLNVLLMKSLVEYATISDAIEKVFASIHLQGPALIADSTMEVMSTILELKSKLNPNIANTASYEQFVTWICQKWRPSNVEDRTYISECSKYISARLILGTLKILVPGNWPSLGVEIFPKMEMLGTARLQRLELDWLLVYLLASDKSSVRCDTLEEPKFEKRDTASVPPNIQNKLVKILVGYFLSELESLSQAWDQLVRGSIAAEAMYTSLTFAIVALVSSSNLTQIDSQATHIFSKSIKLLEEIFRCLSDRELFWRNMDVIINTIAPLLDDLCTVSKYTILSWSEPVKMAFQTISNSSYLLETTTADQAGDEFRRSQDWDLQISPQGRSLDQQDCSSIRSHWTIQGSPLCRRSSTLNYIKFLSLMSDDFNCNEFECDATSKIVASLIKLPPIEFLSAGAFLRMLISAKQSFKPEDAKLLIMYCGDEFLSNYKWERCETSLTLCVDIVSAFVDIWTKDTNLALKDACLDIYSWVVDVAIGESIVSPTVQIAIAHLLSRLLKVQPALSINMSIPTIRYTLFRILRHGELVVRHCVAQKLPEIIEYSGTAHHDDVFNDIHGILPHDIEWLEGIALRLLALSYLGSRCSTLLRKSLYHMFETAGSVETALEYASICITRVAASLNLPSARRLFGLFSSQLLYTWLESHHVDTIPYKVFGYSNLKSLMIEFQSEILAIVLMRHNQEDLKKMEILFTSSSKFLLSKSFGRAFAYALAKDVDSSSLEGKPYRDTENLLIDILGKDLSFNLLQERVPLIVGHMLLRMQHDESAEKVLSKNNDYHFALTAFKEMVSFGASHEKLPPTQQPSFKFKSFLSQVERLHRRLSDKVWADIWSPFSVTVIARMLFDNMQTVLGASDARRTIQRIRVLISFAGTSCLGGYPLEMLLHGLTPLITETECSKDAIGIIQYLLIRGHKYLLCNPSYTLGVCMVMLLTINQSNISQRSARRPESTSLVKLSEVEIFFKWLCKFLEKDIYEKIPQYERPDFGKLTQITEALNGPGSANRSSSESLVLLELLSEFRAEKPRLNAAAAEKSFRLFVSNFVFPKALHDDILSFGNNLSIYRDAIWKSCQMPGMDDQYLLWAGRTLGRAFARNGELPKLPFNNASGISNHCNEDNTRTSTSQVAIWRLLVDTLSSDHQLAVGLAEQSLHYILLNSSREEYESAKAIIPEAIVYVFPRQGKLIWEEEPIVPIPTEPHGLEECFRNVGLVTYLEWIKGLSVALAKFDKDQATLQPIPNLLALIPSLSKTLYQYILHLILLKGAVPGSDITSTISAGYQNCFENATTSTVTHIATLINSLLYLRTQPKPGETNEFERNTWLSIDYQKCTIAAIDCQMFKAALLFLEINDSMLREQYNSIDDAPKKPPANLLLAIFSHIPEPDAFYGIEQETDFSSMAKKFEIEGNSVQQLLLAGASLDTSSRTLGYTSNDFSDVMVESLVALNLNTLSRTLISMRPPTEWSVSMTSSMVRAAIKLRHWDLHLNPSQKSSEATLYRTLQHINSSASMASTFNSLHRGIKSVMDDLILQNHSDTARRNAWQAIAVLSEVEDVLSAKSDRELGLVLSESKGGDKWTKNDGSEATLSYLDAKAIVPSIISTNECIRNSLQLSPQASLQLQAESLLHLSSVLRELGATQQSLSNVVYLSEVKESLEMNQVAIEAEVQVEIASVLWEKGELLPSIKILQDLIIGPKLDRQSDRVARSEILATLGQRISYARLETPDKILEKYLAPALKYLRGETKGSDAGRVFHEYASHCHSQLQSPESVEELHRCQNLRKQRIFEIQELEDALKTCKTAQEKQSIRSSREKAKQWRAIEEREFSRLQRGRQMFLIQCLKNYLKSLAAWDKFDRDTITFLATWLEHAGIGSANETVSNNLSTVPTRKFVSLMNQLASRLQHVQTEFQKILKNLVERLCQDHPYHTMHHIFAGSRTNGGHDSLVVSRTTATLRIAESLKSNPATRKTWVAIYRSDDLYNKLAQLKSKEMKQGVTYLRKFDEARRIERDIPGLFVPPITMAIVVREDLDYHAVPVISCFGPEMTIPSGISVPKILTVLTSTGASLRQLFKGGTDDLRQDSIMEQVFAQVTTILDNDKSTRQRQLKIRTYNVVPLDSTSGAIEFVQPTISLHEFLSSAHERYHPSDLTWKACRERIQSAQELDHELRIKAFNELKPRFKPVLRHFFFERFHDPDDWFQRRLSYTRSTATISILGYILGLGDRHCQNILLDTDTGEVVHIDLGVAFEAGRILPKPELVPFRLTRDIIDGFGLLGTEGVFRRCCEFTLLALRESKDTIMTLLNVLRYDPLHNWTITPVRARRLQAEQTIQLELDHLPARKTLPSNQRRHITLIDPSLDNQGAYPSLLNHETESGEADRALAVVEKKLGFGLSVEAAVHELIQQAIDDRNLAVLFYGWAAYA